MSLIVLSVAFSHALHLTLSSLRPCSRAQPLCKALLYLKVSDGKPNFVVSRPLRVLVKVRTQDVESSVGAVITRAS